MRASRAIGIEMQIERHARRAHHGGQQFALQARARRQIQRDDGRLAETVVTRGEGIARQVDARGVVGEAARRKLARVGFEQARQVGAGFAAVAQTPGIHGVEAQFFERGGERARESREIPPTGLR